ncbi:DegT/DnrJ/EryC1/StrS family aminotransferase [Candidatus Dojkabacteria bacterium]|uniref:DegT/DnrJ/EryC1/StrS family aminotransferase n=1 Tax=Candidatus Dojkabacteria bacterium TaxID=2099670 RepID=A0A955L4E7_9BACT|nr:DegT/DnrJ/EryC1/StrS family aminotransferase [Candidatus Dojkabacteria bacterium]
MNIPISKPIIEDEELKAVNDVLTSGLLVQGEHVAQLEQQFKELCKAKHALAVTNGTTALHIALIGLDLKPGDEVITTPFSFVATVNSILLTGAKPVLVDIEEDSFNINPDLIEEKITENTKAILAVNLYGQTANYTKINEIAKKYNLVVIEDAAQSIGAEHKGTPSGSAGNMACFSLYATKNVMSGEGGMVTTDSDDVYNRMLLFRQHGMDGKNKYVYHSIGHNYRMTNIHAAIGIEQMKKLERFTNRRREIAGLYDEAFKDLSKLSIPVANDDNYHVYHQYTLTINDDKQTFIDYLDENEIGYGIFYPKPLHMVSHISKIGYTEGDFPIAEKVADMVVSIPVHPALTQSEVDYIIEKITNYD